VIPRLTFARAIAPVLALAALAATGCRPHQIDASVENRTGGPIQLLEVDYPYASFGVDSLASGADFHYKFTVIGSGPLTVEYTAQGHQAHITGPNLAEHLQGRLQIILLPGAKAQFLPDLKPAS
jgi:hypothetical protein